MKKQFPLEWGRQTYIMGIINVTPDSFSGDGLLKQDEIIESALKQARRFIASGADILDIGGESTRPGAALISPEEEAERILPIIHALAKAVTDVFISVDTYKAHIAEEAVSAGADWINDVWGLRADPLMAETAARLKTPVILMHNRSVPGNIELQERLGGRYVNMVYQNLLKEVKTELMESVHLAHSAGILDGNIILDPGIGFGKTVEQNLELINRLNEIRTLGYPILLGPSRKGFIGYTLNLPVEQRLEGTAAAVAVGITRGADIIRVHDVEPLSRVARMADAIVRP